MNIYLAGRYTSKERLKKFRDDLGNMHHHVTSQWLDVDDTKTFTEAERDGHAIMDARDIDNSQILIMCTFDDVTGYKGAYFEMGLALGIGLQVILVGPKTGMIFERLTAIRHYYNWDDFRMRVNPATLQPVKVIPPMPEASKV